MNALSDKQRMAAGIAGVLLLLIGLLLPALINRQPILGFDSVGYFHSGYAAVKEAKVALDVSVRGRAAEPGPVLTDRQADGVTTARSVYYGLAYVVGFFLVGVWAVPAAQILLTLACLILAARRTVRLELLPWFAALAGIVLLTGLNVFAVTVMPDLFAGLMLLASAMILAYGPKLPRLEYVFWLAVIAAAGLFHKAHLAILALSLLAAGGLILLWRQRWGDLLLIALAGLVGLAGHLAVDLTVRQLTGKPPIAVPFALARLVGDGTAQIYLGAVCPGRHYVTCDYLSRMPMSENDFLWSRDETKSVMGTASRETRMAIAAESDAIVWGALRAYPMEEARAAARNVLMQLSDVGVAEFGLVPKDDIAPIPALRLTLDRYQSTAIAQGRMPLVPFSIFMRGIYFAALVGIGILLLRRKHGMPAGDPDLHFVILLLTGIVANAVVTGAVSGVFDRYQGRVAWLASLGFAVLVAKMLAEQRGSSNPLKAR